MSQHLQVVDTLFIDIGDIYCFWTGLPYQCAKMYINITIVSKTITVNMLK